MGLFGGTKSKLKTFSTIEDWQRGFGETLSDILGEAAPEMIKRVFERDEKGDILADFKKYFSAPAMRMWKDVIAPTVAEGFNLPGAFYSRDRYRGVQRSGEEFLTQRVNPLLFGALESSEQRELQRQAIIANIMTGSQSLAVSPTISGTAVPGSKGMGGGIGALLGIGGSLMGMPFFGDLSPLMAGGAGALIGGAFD